MDTAVPKTKTSVNLMYPMTGFLSGLALFITRKLKLILNNSLKPVWNSVM